MYSIPIRRSFGVILALILPALLLSLWNNKSASIEKRELLTEESSILNSSTDTSVSYPAVRHDHRHAHSHIYTPKSHAIEKRARTLTFADAVCKGRKLYGQIQDAFEGKHPSGYEFGQKDIVNGWTREQYPRGLPSTFDDPFKAIGKTIPNLGDRIPESGETLMVDLILDQPYRNAAGKQQKALPKINGIPAHYEVYYIPGWNAMISSDTRSPRYQVERFHNFQISPNDVKELMPPLNRQSDVMWTLWKNISRTPNDLRYICRDGISNDDTKGIMTDIFSHGPARAPIPWPGLRFTMDIDEGLALLGTPNGLAIAWILIDRAKDLGRRKLSVTIAASKAAPGAIGQGYRMLWDLEPPSSPQLTISIPNPDLGISFTSSPTATAKKASSTFRSER